MEGRFFHDVFLSHSAKDEAVVRPLAERLRADGLKVWPVPPKRQREGGFDEWVLKPGDRIPAEIDPPTLRGYGGTREGLEHSRVLARPGEARLRRRMLCMSANAFGSDWGQLARPTVASARRRKAGTCGRGNLPFRDPLNQERRFIPLRLDDAPIKGSLAQFLYINWLPNPRKQEYEKLLKACESTGQKRAASVEDERNSMAAQPNGEPAKASEDYLRRRRNTIEEVFSAFESIHAFFFKVCIEYLSFVEVLHAGLSATVADRDKYYGYIKEIGQRLHEIHILEGRLRVAGAEQSVCSMQQYRLQATEVNDMLQLQRPKLNRSGVKAVADELFLRKDRLYHEFAKALKTGEPEQDIYA